MDGGNPTLYWICHSLSVYNLVECRTTLRETALSSLDWTSVATRLKDNNRQVSICLTSKMGWFIGVWSYVVGEKWGLKTRQALNFYSSLNYVSIVVLSVPF